MTHIKSALLKAFEEKGLAAPELKVAGQTIENLKIDSWRNAAKSRSDKQRMDLEGHETDESAVIPSSFYSLLEPSRSFTLTFPINAEGVGPYWNDEGGLDLSKCSEWYTEDVTLVELGAGLYRLVCKEMGPFSVLRLFWGDEFNAETESENSLRITCVQCPERFIHYTLLVPAGFGTAHPLEGIIHELEGGWELLAGGLLTITIPKDRVNVFQGRLKLHEWGKTFPFIPISL